MKTPVPPEFRNQHADGRFKMVSRFKNLHKLDMSLWIILSIHTYVMYLV